MVEKLKWLTIGKTTGQPIQVGGRTIVPEAQRVALMTPFGGFVWNRPTAVLVQTAGDPERVPILDVTRYALLGLLALPVIILLLGERYGRSPS